MCKSYYNERLLGIITRPMQYSLLEAPGLDLTKDLLRSYQVLMDFLQCTWPHLLSETIVVTILFLCAKENLNGWL